MIFSKQTGKLILVMVIITIIAVSVAYIYYGGKNKSEDPRVSEVKKMFPLFDQLLQNLQYDDAFSKLADIESILAGTPCYNNSYEMGVVMNNRASIFLLMALYDSTGVDSVKKQEWLMTSEKYVLKSIEIYENWIHTYGSLPEDSILLKIEPFFPINDAAFKGKSVKRIIKRRVNDIIEAQFETNRRISVSYSNLGIVRRHQYRFQEAIEAFEKSLTYWDDNLSSKNNLNTLLGLPLEKRTFLQKLFPPDRLKE